MSRLFVGNFDFEPALTRNPRTVPESVRRISAELAAAWVAVAEDGDFVWTPEVIDAAFFDQLVAAGLPRVRPVSRNADVPAGTEICPWGWTDAIRQQADRYSWTGHAPPQAAVREANSRRFSFELEVEWGVGLAGASLITHATELPDALDRLPAGLVRWILKAEFGMSARERLIGAGRSVTSQTAAWLRRRLADGIVTLEPWVERLEEAGLQFDVPAGGGESRLVGITPLLTDATGVYRGSRFHADPLLEHAWSEAIAIGARAAVRLQALGYFGPVGFDAVRYRAEDGTIRTRALQDINARWTMGRLALGFRRLLADGERGTWLHVNRPASRAEEHRSWLDSLRQRLPHGAHLTPTSPAKVGGQPTRRQTFLLRAPNCEDLRKAERVCL